jgi:RNA polymerase sigma factor (sigma-70 family)
MAHDILNDFPSDRLTTEQEESLAADIKGGSEAAQTTLTMHNMREAVIYMRRVNRDELPDDELVGVCYAALMRNAKRFRPGWRRFFVFAKAGLRGAVKRHWKTRKIVRNAETVSMEAAHTEHAQRTDSEILGIDDVLRPVTPALFEPEQVEPDFAGIFTRERWEFVSKIIDAKCSEQEKMVLSLAYQSGFNFQEIGNMLRVSRSAIQSVHARALKKVRCSLFRTKQLFPDQCAY